MDGRLSVPEMDVRVEMLEFEIVRDNIVLPPTPTVGAKYDLATSGSWPYAVALVASRVSTRANVYLEHGISCMRASAVQFGCGAFKRCPRV